MPSRTTCPVGVCIQLFADRIQNPDRAVPIATSTAEMTPDETTGWVYNSATQEIIANLTGSDSNGTAYATY